MPHKITLSITRFQACSALALGAVMAIAALAFGGIVPLDGGWEAVVPDDGPQTVVNVTHTGAVTIDVDLTFTALVPSEILVRQINPDATTYTALRFVEHVHNNTSTAWTGYNLDLLAGGQAYFLSSSGPSALPFTTVEYVDDYGFPQPTTRRTGMHFSGGMLLPGESMDIAMTGGSRSGPGFDIRMDLSAEAPVEFTIRQLAIPEPAMIGLALGAALLVIGRRWFFRR